MQPDEFIQIVVNAPDDEKLAAEFKRRSGRDDWSGFEIPPPQS